MFLCCVNSCSLLCVLDTRDAFRFLGMGAKYNAAHDVKSERSKFSIGYRLFIPETNESKAFTWCEVEAASLLPFLSFYNRMLSHV